MLPRKMTCDHCGSMIIQYYNEGYKGNRGKCLICKIDFPLE